MSYVTPDDVREVLNSSGSTTDGTAASLSDQVLQNHIDEAQSQVDGILRGTYDVPLDPVPKLISSITAVVAAYIADLDYRKNKPYTSQQSPILLRYQRASTLLTQVGNGSITLDVDPTQAEDSNGEALNPMYPGDLFTLRDFNLGFGLRGIRTRYPRGWCP